MAACLIVLVLLVASSDTAASYYYSTPPVLDSYSASSPSASSSVWSLLDWLLADPAAALLAEMEELRLRLARAERQLSTLSQHSAISLVSPSHERRVSASSRPATRSSL